MRVVFSACEGDILMVFIHKSIPGAFFLIASALNLFAEALDLSNSVIFAPSLQHRAEEKAIDLLTLEIEKRTGIHWQKAEDISSREQPIIVVGKYEVLMNTHPALLEGRLEDHVSLPPEGYRLGSFIKTDGQSVVYVAGSDSRGVLFGVGRLLRILAMSQGRIEFSNNFRETSAPVYSIRGHQLGYRPKSNTYDAWSLPMWEQYIRDLVVFGTNAVELIPPKSDDVDQSPHFPLPKMEMLRQLSRLLDDYDLDVWLWYPARYPDYDDNQTVNLALQEADKIFSKLQRLDAVFAPGGDPGHTRPKHLLAFMEKQAEVLRRYHPEAQIWVSPQHFGAGWLEEFFEILDQEPAWLTGIVYGPHTRITLKQLRERTPSRYLLRRYPDIGHTRQCQYPVPNWDMAYAITEGRESINPRPLAFKHINDLHARYAEGFITYSEGVNDDVNKICFSSLGWNPETPAHEILREYSRYFIGQDYGDDFAQALLSLEENWKGPLLPNVKVYTTLQQFQFLERSASADVLANWRFQMGLYRAYYDAYIRSRLIYETSLEDSAMTELRKAHPVGSLKALDAAEKILNRAETDPVSRDWRNRVFELAEDLFQSIGMQLSVDLYQATEIHRGANLDSIDLPLNNRLWLRKRFKELRVFNEKDRLAGISELVNHADPGLGGFYDDLGNPTRQPHLVTGPGFEKDPMFRRSSLVGFGERTPEFIDYPIYWWRYAQSLYDEPLEMSYKGLDPDAQYLLQVVYAGDSPDKKMRLIANDHIEIHPLIERETPFRRLLFSIPRQATANGALFLSWRREQGLGGNGRGCQVAEVWLIKVEE